MKLVKKNVRRFESQEEYEEYYENHEMFDYITNIVENENNVCADATYSCKTWKTAVKRFFGAIAEETTLTKGWDAKSIIELIEDNYWNDKSTIWNDQTGKSEYTGDYAWGVEQIDFGIWYIYLKVGKGAY